MPSEATEGRCVAESSERRGAAQSALSGGTEEAADPPDLHDTVDAPVASVAGAGGSASRRAPEDAAPCAPSCVGMSSCISASTAQILLAGLFGKPVA